MTPETSKELLKFTAVEGQRVILKVNNTNEGQ
jgi:hypothetical protein